VIVRKKDEDGLRPSLPPDDSGRPPNAGGPPLHRSGGITFWSLGVCAGESEALTRRLAPLFWVAPGSEASEALSFGLRFPRSPALEECTLHGGALGTVISCPFPWLRCCAVWRILSFPRAPFDGASLAVIRSGQGDAWGCSGFPAVVWDPPFWERVPAVGVAETRSVFRSVLMGSVGCWPMAIVNR
jgi:hypothetical protein